MLNWLSGISIWIFHRHFTINISKTKLFIRFTKSLPCTKLSLIVGTTISPTQIQPVFSLFSNISPKSAIYPSASYQFSFKTYPSNYPLLHSLIHTTILSARDDEQPPVLHPHHQSSGHSNLHKHQTLLDLAPASFCSLILCHHSPLHPPLQFIYTRRLLAPGHQRRYVLWSLSRSSLVCRALHTLRSQHLFFIYFSV